MLLLPPRIVSSFVLSPVPHSDGIGKKELRHEDLSFKHITALFTWAQLGGFPCLAECIRMIEFQNREGQGSHQLLSLSQTRN